MENKPSLEILLEQAADAKEPPPIDLKKIPTQWLPSWIRWPVRAIFLPFILLDLAAQRVARSLIPPPFKQVGSCLKRGNCCHYILIPKPKGLLGTLYYFWNTQVLGFYPSDGGDKKRKDLPVYESEGKEVLVMRCRYLKQNGSCSHYRLRPTVCRKWPMIEYFGYPRALKGCGFRAVLRNQIPNPPDSEN